MLVQNFHKKTTNFHEKLTEKQTKNWKSRWQIGSKIIIINMTTDINVTDALHDLSYLNRWLAWKHTGLSELVSKQPQRAEKTWSSLSLSLSVSPSLFLSLYCWHTHAKAKAEHSVLKLSAFFGFYPSNLMEKESKILYAASQLQVSPRSFNIAFLN